jgi:4-hydroxybenzoate polyprenyltransferase
MACYIVGLSYLARQESAMVALRYWPCVLLAAPLVLALIVNRGEFQLRAVVLAVALWMVRSLGFALWSSQRNVGRSVSGLLAGIPLLDLLSTWGASPGVMLVFLSLFLLALLFQRFVPAT